MGLVLNSPGIPFVELLGFREQRDMFGTVKFCSKNIEVYTCRNSRDVEGLVLNNPGVPLLG